VIIVEDIVDSGHSLKYTLDAVKIKSSECDCLCTFGETRGAAVSFRGIDLCWL
jgi:hypoxanthine-guanine phosphoribosyltransferase